MSDINFSRQETLGLKLPKAVAVVGVGGVGSYASIYLAMAGVPELWLFDMDEISDHNLNRVPVPTSAIGRLKTHAIRDEILRLRPKCRIMCMGGFDKDVAESLSLQDTVQWIVATTDTAASRRMTAEWSEEHGVRYVEAAAEGEIGSATGEPAGWSTEGESNPGYRSVPAWNFPCAVSALMAVAHIVHDTPMGDRTIRMGWADGRLSIFDSEAMSPSVASKLTLAATL